MLDEKVSQTLSQDDKDIVNKEVDSALDWITQNPSADVNSYDSKYKEIESKVTSIMSKLGGQQSTQSGMPEGFDQFTKSAMPTQNEPVNSPKIEEVD